MIKKAIVCAISAALAGNVFSASYTQTVNLSDTKIGDGDIVRSNSSGIITGKPTNNKIDLGTGSITIDLNNTVVSNSENYGIQLRDSINHNLGVFSKINISNEKNKSTIYGLNINGVAPPDYTNVPEINAKKINIDVTNKIAAAQGIYVNQAKLNLGSFSVIKVNGGGSSIDNIVGISANNKSIVTASDLTIDTNGGHGISMDGADVNVGDNTKIFAANSALHMTSPSVFNAGKNLYLKTTNNVSYAININAGGNTADLGDGAVIETSGNKSNAIRVMGYSGDYSALMAKNLTISNKGTGTIGVYVSNGKATIDGAEINVASGQGIFADSTDLGIGPGDADILLSNAHLTVADGSGVISVGKNSHVTLDNVSVSIANNTKNQLFAVRSLKDAEIIAKNTAITADETVIGGYAAENGKLEFDGQTYINILGDKAMALLANKGSVTVNGLTDITGAIAAQGGGTLVMDTTAGSQFNGRIGRASDSLVTWSGKGSTWNVTGDSMVDKLSLTDNSNVNLAHNSGYQTVSVGDLVGSSNFNFKIDFDSQQSDYLKVLNSSAGNHTVSLVNNGSAITDGTERISIIETPDGAATFKNKGEYEFGGYLYGVRRENNDPVSTNWEVISTGEKTKPADATISTVTGNYLINLAEQEHLSQRMGALRTDNAQYGTWVRSYGGKFKSFGHQLRGFDMDYYGIQAGADKLISQTDSGVWSLGSALAYTTSDQNYASGSGKQKSYSGTLYATYFTGNDWYTDVYLKYAHYKNDIDVRDSAGEKVTGNGSANGITASVEAGKRFVFSDVFYAEPGAQLTVGNINSNTINNSNGLRVDFDRQTSVITRIGSKFGYNSLTASQPVSFYTRLNYVREFDGEQVYKLNGHKDSVKLDGNWVEYGAGVSTVVNNKHTLFAEVNGSNGNKFDKYDVNIGYRYSF